MSGPAESTVLQPCKRCGLRAGMLTPSRRIELHALVLAAFDRWYRTPITSRSDLSCPSGQDVREGLARANWWTQLLVADDQTLCVACADHIERPAP